MTMIELEERGEYCRKYCALWSKAALKFLVARRRSSDNDDEEMISVQMGTPFANNTLAKTTLASHLSAPLASSQGVGQSLSQCSFAFDQEGPLEPPSKIDAPAAPALGNDEHLDFGPPSRWLFFEFHNVGIGRHMLPPGSNSVSDYDAVAVIRRKMVSIDAEGMSSRLCLPSTGSAIDSDTLVLSSHTLSFAEWRSALSWKVRKALVYDFADPRVPSGLFSRMQKFVSPLVGLIAGDGHIFHHEEGAEDLCLQWLEQHAYARKLQSDARCSRWLLTDHGMDTLCQQIMLTDPAPIFSFSGEKKREPCEEPPACRHTSHPAHHFKFQGGPVSYKHFTC